MRSPFRRKSARPKKLIVFGEQGVKPVRYVGDLPVEYRGRVTGTLYVWNERHPTRGVDKRDLPGLAEDGGRHNFEGLPPEEKEEIEAEIEAEVGDYGTMDNDG